MEPEVEPHQTHPETQMPSPAAAAAQQSVRACCSCWPYAAHLALQPQAPETMAAAAAAAAATIAAAAVAALPPRLVLLMITIMIGQALGSACQGHLHRSPPSLRRRLELRLSLRRRRHAPRYGRGQPQA